LKRSFSDEWRLSNCKKGGIFVAGKGGSEAQRKDHEQGIRNAARPGERITDG